MGTLHRSHSRRQGVAREAVLLQGKNSCDLPGQGRCAGNAVSRKSVSEMLREAATVLRASGTRAAGVGGLSLRAAPTLLLLISNIGLEIQTLRMPACLIHLSTPAELRKPGWHPASVSLGCPLSGWHGAGAPLIPTID